MKTLFAFRWAMEPKTAGKFKAGRLLLASLTMLATAAIFTESAQR
jgi:hypothetical protein